MCFVNLLQVLLGAQRQVLYLDSLNPKGFGDESYRNLFRL